MAPETRGKNSGIVNDDKLVTAQDVGKLAELPVLPSAGTPVKQQHTRSVAFFKRPLRNALRRQLVIEIAQVQFARSPVTRSQQKYGEILARRGKLCYDSNQVQPAAPVSHLQNASVNGRANPL
jgi:hypothetical protein